MISRKETILLVEDDEQVRTLIKRVLQQQGYVVLEASNGHEALEVARQFKKNIHLLIADVVLPKLSGKALADQLNQIRPEIKHLFMSGYPDHIIAHNGPIEQIKPLLQKPMSLATLLGEVRTMLDGAGGVAALSHTGNGVVNGDRLRNTRYGSKADRDMSAVGE